MVSQAWPSPAANHLSIYPDVNKLRATNKDRGSKECLISTIGFPSPFVSELYASSYNTKAYPYTSPGPARLHFTPNRLLATRFRRDPRPRRALQPRLAALGTFYFATGAYWDQAASLSTRNLKRWTTMTEVRRVLCSPGPGRRRTSPFSPCNPAFPSSQAVA